MSAASSRLPAAAMLLLVAVLVARARSYETDPLDPSLTWHQPHDLVSFDVAGGDYADLIQKVLPTLLVRWSTNRVGTTQVLHRQSVNQKPFRWLMLELTAGDGDDKIMLAIRQDNLYVAGFTDKKGNWFVFYNKAELHLIPAATVSFSDSYGGLVGGYEQLQDLYAGRDTTLRAVKEIANFVLSPTEDEGCVARAVAVMAVTFCEALRFNAIMLTLRDNWQHGVYIGGMNRLVVRWGKMSCAVLLSVQNNGRWWQSNEAKELWNNDGYDEPTVRHEVLLLLWPACSQGITWLKG